MLDSGWDQVNQTFYVVTELLGSDIWKLLMACPEKKFSLPTAARIGLQMFNRIQALHSKCSFVHRDIKLNNFVCSSPDNYVHPDSERVLFRRQQTIMKREISAGGNELGASRREASADVSQFAPGGSRGGGGPLLREGRRAKSAFRRPSAIITHTAVQNTAPEDDLVITLIDFGISKKFEKKTAKEPSNPLERLKKM